jgi:hypothetical protein
LWEPAQTGDAQLDRETSRQNRFVLLVLMTPAEELDSGDPRR